MSLSRSIRRNKMKMEIGSNKIKLVWRENRYKFLLKKSKLFPKLKVLVKCLLFSNSKKEKQRLFNKINGYQL